MEYSSSIEDSMLLAMFDDSEVNNANQNQHALDERLTFLDAVRVSSIQHGKRPTSKIIAAVFHMLRTGQSLELIMASYKLLVDLDKHFPRVYLDDSQSASTNSPPKLVVFKEAWSPFIVGGLNATPVSKNGDNKKPDGGPLDPHSFHLLIKELVETLSETKFQTSSMEKLLLFQYLVIALEGDFLPRNATMNWNLQRESLLNMLLGSRKINYNSLMKDCMEVIFQICHLHQKSSESQLSVALLEALNNTRVSLEKFFVMIMAFDMSRKKADTERHTSRADRSRTPLVDIILDELAYNNDNVSLFLKIFNEPNWKLEIVVQYLWKYITKSTRTRPTNGGTEDTTFNGALKSFSNNTTAKNIIKIIDADVVQLLLAHGFQAQLSILSEGNPDDNISGNKEEGGSALVDLCETFISAFVNLRSTDEKYGDTVDWKRSTIYCSNYYLHEVIGMHIATLT